MRTKQSKHGNKPTTSNDQYGAQLLIGLRISTSIEEKAGFYKATEPLHTIDVDTFANSSCDDSNRGR